MLVLAATFTPFLDKVVLSCQMFCRCCAGGLQGDFAQVTGLVCTKRLCENSHTCGSQVRFTCAEARWRAWGKYQADCADRRRAEQGSEQSFQVAISVAQAFASWCTTTVRPPISCAMQHSAHDHFCLSCNPALVWRVIQQQA